MFQKIAKHRANDASNDVHRPPLPCLVLLWRLQQEVCEWCQPTPPQDQVPRRVSLIFTDIVLIFILNQRHKQTFSQEHNGSSNECSSSSWSCLVFSSAGAFIFCLAQMSSLWLDRQNQKCADQAHEGRNRSSVMIFHLFRYSQLFNKSKSEHLSYFCCLFSPIVRCLVAAGELPITWWGLNSHTFLYFIFWGK